LVPVLKVKELINLLYKQNPEHEVYVHGYEGGVNEVNGIYACKVLLNYNNDWYMGRHEMFETNGKTCLDEEQKEGYEQAPGVYISSARTGQS
jgi:hypothetical protein